jgi:hypothetical protein
MKTARTSWRDQAQKISGALASAFISPLKFLSVACAAAASGCSERARCSHGSKRCVASECTSACIAAMSSIECLARERSNCSMRCWRYGTAHSLVR